MEGNFYEKKKGDNRALVVIVVIFCVIIPASFLGAFIYVTLTMQKKVDDVANMVKNNQSQSQTVQFEDEIIDTTNTANTLANTVNTNTAMSNTTSNTLSNTASTNTYANTTTNSAVSNTMTTNTSSSNTNTTSMNNSSMQNQEVQIFNSKFSAYEGTQNGANIKALLNSVNANNADGFSSKVYVSYGFYTNVSSTEDLTKVLNEIGTSDTYNVTMGKNSSTGYIESITIRK